MYEYVKTGCKHIVPTEQPLQSQSGYYLKKPLIHSTVGETRLNAAMKDVFTFLSQFLSTLSVLLTKYYSDDQFKENAMRHRYGTMQIYSRFWWGILMERDNKKRLVVDGRLIFISKEQDWRAGAILT